MTAIMRHSNRNRPSNPCNQTPCCLAQLTLEELHEVVSLAFAATRDAVLSNDPDGVDYFRDWHDRFSDELERRRQGCAQ
jgi:hypothetical protein